MRDATTEKSVKKEDEKRCEIRFACFPQPQSTAVRLEGQKYMCIRNKLQKDKPEGSKLHIIRMPFLPVPRVEANRKTMADGPKTRKWNRNVKKKTICKLTHLCFVVSQMSCRYRSLVVLNRMQKRIAYMMPRGLEPVGMEDLRIRSDVSRIRRFEGYAHLAISVQAWAENKAPHIVANDSRELSAPEQSTETTSLAGARCARNTIRGDQ
ncbi:hypothetical protein DFH11DRAFT_312955 [Phellopilus nigrolimitatus]|nr:hypothetical protein DFH11DRAFT_312955 [Phellopilus nigrolimitatus]